MTRGAQTQTSVVTAGSFLSLPEAFPEADDAVKYVPKVEVRTARFEDSRHPLQIEPVLEPHRILMDLEAVDSDAFDPKKLIRDCELLKRAAESHPEKLRAILAAFAKDAPHDRILDAARVASELGLDEGFSSQAGGGLLWLVVVAAALAMSSCKSCAHTKGRMRQ